MHEATCPCVGCEASKWCGATNEDHFTPICVGKKIGWTYKEIGRPENKQWLSRPCHVAKDRSTPARKHKHTFKTLDDLRNWRNSHNIVYIDTSE